MSRGLLESVRNSNQLVLGERLASESDSKWPSSTHRKHVVKVLIPLRVRNRLYLLIRVHAQDAGLMMFTALISDFTLDDRNIVA